MRLLVHANSDALRSSFSFSASGLVHGVILALVVFGDSFSTQPERAQSLYDTVIRPQERRIVWYHLPDRLPQAQPPGPARAVREPLRATRKFEQRIVAGPKDDDRPPTMVWSPAPETATPKAQPLPNLIAVELKGPARLFLPPQTPAPVSRIRPLPEAPEVTAHAAPAGPALRPLVKTFTPLESKPTAVAKLPDFPAAPSDTPLAAAPAGPALRQLVKTFTPPESKPTAVAKLPDLPAAPSDSSLGAAPAGPALHPLVKTFSPPESQPTAVAKLPDVPAAPPDSSLGAAPTGPTLRPLVKTFSPPPSRTGPPETPLSAAPPAPALAIIGLDPALRADLPAPPPPRAAGFSAGPTAHPNGADYEGDASGIPLPGITIRDGVSRRELLAAVQPVARAGPPMPADSALPIATPVAGAPDPALAGRNVYALAIQMPNVTSYSGSWLVWFAAREKGAAGTVRPPTPLRKVDPKYIAAAAADRVEGVVRLAAVIRQDGGVEAVRLLRHLDDRLDRSAIEALAKWEFAPALRDGAAIDIDAVFEIPFRLAPRPLK